MIKFKDLLEKSGAGDWGTDELRKTLEKGTPGQGITDMGVKNKERKESVELDEATDFSAGDAVYQVGSKLKGTVLHKGNQDKIVVKFGSINKMIPASQLRLAEEVEIDESEYKVIKVVGDDYKNKKKDITYGTFPATDKGRDQATLFQLKLKRQKAIETDLVWESLDEITIHQGIGSDSDEVMKQLLKLLKKSGKRPDLQKSLERQLKKTDKKEEVELGEGLSDIFRKIKTLPGVTLDLTKALTAANKGDLQSVKMHINKALSRVPEEKREKAEKTFAKAISDNTTDKAMSGIILKMYESAELDELDSKTYRSYIDKAQQDQINRMQKKKQTDKDKQTMRRRSLGIATAQGKQYGDKRSTSQRIRGEEVELDELSPVTKMKAAIARGIRGPSKKATPTWARETGKAAKELKKRAAQKAEYEKKKRAMQKRGALTSFKEGKSFKDVAEKACWKGYKQVGMKKKNGKEVPNCVPEEKE